MKKSENGQNANLGPTLRQVYDHFFWSKFFLISPAVFFKPFSFHLNNQNFFNQSGFFGILVEKIPILVDPPLKNRSHSIKNVFDASIIAGVKENKEHQ